jgi:hypothetical protein
MCSKKTSVYVCPLSGLAMALAVASPSARQNIGRATEAPSDYDKQNETSNAWAFYKKLSLRQDSANPSAYNERGDPRRRSLCAV